MESIEEKLKKPRKWKYKKDISRFKKENHKEEMGIENERERTSSMLDCKHNVLHKPILLKMEKEIINL